METPHDPGPALEEAARDLYFPSESEAPIDLYRWPLEAEPTPEALLAHEGRPAETPIDTTTPESEIAPFTTAPEGSDEIEVALAKRWTTLLETLHRELTDVRVYRVGKVDIDLFILGRAPSGGFLGYKTHVVET